MVISRLQFIFSWFLKESLVHLRPFINCSTDAFMSSKIPRSDVGIWVALILTMQFNSCARSRAELRQSTTTMPANLAVDPFQYGMCNVFGNFFLVFEFKTQGVLVPVNYGYLVGIVPEGSSVVFKCVQHNE